MSLRATHKSQLQGGEFDVLVIGAGINGAASASALAHRGLRTALVDARDFAGYTSQSSSNLIWGGIKYLETFEFALVRRLCSSRNVLMRAYPTAVRETRFLAAISRTAPRSRLAVWLGAWLYWFLGSCKTRIPRLLSRAALKRAEPVVNADVTQGAVEYSDALLVDGDARFVCSLVRRAADAGCVTVNYLNVVNAERSGEYWRVDLLDSVDGGKMSARARVIINAAGPFADPLAGLTNVATGLRHMLSKGIHLITDRLSAEPRVLAFYADDGRPFFVIPLGNRASIGTTDTPVETPTVAVDEADRDFVLSNINARLDLKSPLSRHDVIDERCGVRPLAVDPREKGDGGGDFLSLSRKHVIETHAGRACVSIYGGKLTDCLDVGAEVRDAVLSLGVVDPGGTRDWYGESGTRIRNAFLAKVRLLRGASIVFGEAQSERLWRCYDSRALKLVEKFEDEPDTRDVILAADGITRGELELVRDTEMVVTLEDFLRRRTLLTQTRGKDELAGPAMMQVCEILFGSKASVRYQEYFGTNSSEEA